MYDDYYLSESEKVRRLPKYIKDNIGEYIKTLPKYEARDWEALKTLLKKKFKKGDNMQLMATKEYLKVLSLKKRDIQKVKIYCRQFANVSKKLVETGAVN